MLCPASHIAVKEEIGPIQMATSHTLQLVDGHEANVGNEQKSVCPLGKEQWWEELAELAAK